jgi:hypothetical protein
VKLPKIVVSGHEWHRNAVGQFLAVVVPFVSFVLASGAGHQWW